MSHTDPTVRHEAVIAFDAIDSNPNGDPDGQRQPRTDAETGHGLVTDVALKRKIRDTVPLLRPDDDRYGIFVEAGRALNTRTAAAPADADPAQWLCGRYFDVRVFGAVLTRGKGKGSLSVRGPVQVGMARSVHPVLPVRQTITRVTQVRQADIDRGETTEIGSSWTVPYGLYVAHLYYSASLGAKTGITADDLAALWQSITQMFDLTRSRARTGVDLAGLWVFSHATPFGVAPARQLLDSVRFTTDADPPRRLHDYALDLPASLPAGVTMTTVYNAWETQ